MFKPTALAHTFLFSPSISKPAEEQTAAKPRSQYSLRRPFTNAGGALELLSTDAHQVWRAVSCPRISESARKHCCPNFRLPDPTPTNTAPLEAQFQLGCNCCTSTCGLPGGRLCWKLFTSPAAFLYEELLSLPEINSA